MREKQMSEKNPLRKKKKKIASTLKNFIKRGRIRK